MADWVISLMDQGGYLTVALLMFLENVFPPIPSELVMPLAGYTAQQGRLHIVAVIAAGSVGSFAGACAWYAVGRWIGCARLKAFARRHGRWLTLSTRDIDQADAWFDRHGGKAVLLGRMVPAVRTLISVPAGIAEMRIAPFLAYTAAGTVAWTAALAAAGWFLGNGYDAVSQYLNPVSNGVVGILFAGYLYRVATFGRAERRYERKKASR